jgi:hypothetical protein
MTRPPHPDENEISFSFAKSKPQALKYQIPPANQPEIPPMFYPNYKEEYYQVSAPRMQKAVTIEEEPDRDRASAVIGPAKGEAEVGNPDLSGCAEAKIKRSGSGALEYTSQPTIRKVRTVEVYNCYRFRCEQEA